MFPETLGPGRPFRAEEGAASRSGSARPFPLSAGFGDGIAGCEYPGI